MYQFLDIFFLVFHSALILFNLFGWIFRKTRKLNLITLLLTGASWYFLGLFYGMGYCPLTDWHFDVIYQLGRSPGTNSYVHYLLKRLLGLNIAADAANTLTVVCFFAALLASIYVNFLKKYIPLKKSS
ncbi:MAG: DUF2784 domain-containing protein [Bacteroidales bacterium]|nr:DUF2784 domain-containing protein [Bacteroidales bacterium]MCF8345177.1 DUF2784 domain-containing protein [Bacteroidales bacterium]MCF8350068.1 DUF2784 domain-containing protein [Bacteroidales bacterium]MCF8374988.1 DUF2784 domain-containing protein [Bacteroidales bacterium]